MRCFVLGYIGFGWIRLTLVSLFKVPLARGSDPYMISHISKCTSHVVVVRSWVRFSNLHSRVVVIRTCQFFQSAPRAW